MPHSFRFTMLLLFSALPVAAQTAAVQAPKRPAHSVVVQTDLQRAAVYWKGDGVPKDIPQALKLYEAAASKGSGEAQLFLGMAYYAGQEVPKDHVLAVKYLRAAADQNLAAAQFYVASMYFNGDGVEKSVPLATKYLQEASDGKVAGASFMLGMMYASGKELPVDLVKSCALFEKATALHYAPAMNMLGACYDKGLGGRADKQKALTYFKLAAENGAAEGAANAATVYASTNDWENVLIWLRIAEFEGAIQNRPAIEQVRTRLSDAQLVAAETAVRTWEKAHPQLGRK